MCSLCMCSKFISRDASVSSEVQWHPASGRGAVQCSSVRSVHRSAKSADWWCSAMWVQCHVGAVEKKKPGHERESVIYADLKTLMKSFTSNEQWFCFRSRKYVVLPQLSSRPKYS